MLVTNIKTNIINVKCYLNYVSYFSQKPKLKKIYSILIHLHLCPQLWL